MNEIIIDQIPNLTDVLKTLEQMSIMNTNAQVSRNPFVVQQIPELRRSIAEGRDWESIAEYQLNTFFTKEAEASEFDQLVKFADMYSQTNIEALSEGFKCANCLKPATQRCSRCKTIWYCTRECQVDHYKKEHKLQCKALAEKQSLKHDKTGHGEGGVIIKPSEVKSQSAKLNQIPQGKNPEEQNKPKFKVEILNSTDNEASQSRKEDDKEPKESIVDKQEDKTKTDGQVIVREEEVNKMEELD